VKVTGALVRYVWSDAARSQRWLAPVLLFVTACALFNSDAGPMLTTYADTVACLFVASIWMTWVVTNSEDAVLASITAVTIGGPTRLRAMKLVTAFLSCSVLGLFATALPVVLHNHPDAATVGHVGAGFIGHLLAAGAGVGVGSLLMQSVIRRAGWAFLVATGAFLVEILVPNCPPVRQLLVLFNDDPPRHLASSLAVCGGETAVVVGVLVAGALWVARTRS
jgi:hypothetical protein